MAILAQDTFSRANTAGSTTISNANGWGAASDGSTWTDPNGPGGTWKITGNEGQQTVNWGTTALLGSGTSADTEGLVRLTSSNFASNFPGIVLRSSATGSTSYFARVTSTGVTVFNEAFTTICSYALTLTNSTYYWLRFRAQGTTLSVKLWADGSSEPSPWGATGTNSGHASGRYGLYESVASGSVSFDNFSVNDTQSGSAAPLRFSDGYGGVFS